MGKIVWLASYPKSGNTWLRAFLHNLLRDPQDGYDINRITDFCANDSAVGWYAPFIGRAPGNWTEEEVGKARRKAHEAITKVHPDSAFVKTHNALTFDRFGPLITMELTAGAIYILRNPLDVAISYSHHLGETIDWTIRLMNSPGAGTPNTPTNVFQQLRSWSEHVRSWTARPHPGLHVIRYEEMLSAPEQTFWRGCELSGLAAAARASVAGDRALRLSRIAKARGSARLSGTRAALEALFPRRSRRSVARSSHADTGPAHRRSTRPDHAAIRLFSAGWLRERV